MTVFFQRAPKMITNLISRQNSEYNLRGQAQNPFDPKIPNVKSRAACNSFSVKAPVHWNNTPIELRQIEQKPLFKKTRPYTRAEVACGWAGAVKS